MKKKLVAALMQSMLGANSKPAPKNKKDKILTPTDVFYIEQAQAKRERRKQRNLMVTLR